MKENPVSPARPRLGGFFRTKSLDAILQDSERPEHQLKRQLGPVQITLLGIGAIIGAGIFATIGTAAKGDIAVGRPGAGPALVLSFVITAVVCAFTALCYAEFASMIPISGSAYTYAYATLGEMIAWIIGWDLIIEYAVGNIGVAISWANYYKTLLLHTKIPFLYPNGIEIKAWLSMDYRAAAKFTETLPNGATFNKVFAEAPHLFGQPIVFNALAVAIVTIITLILLVGVRESAWFNAVMVGIKIVVLTFFIIVGSLWLDTSNWQPFMPPKGWQGISAGAAIIFFAYIGFDAVSTVAEETKNPRRNLPIGIFASLIICTIFYIAVAAVFTGLISYQDLQSKNVSEDAEPLTMAMLHARPNAGWAVLFVAFGSVIAHTAVLLVYQLGQPRIFFSMARDGLLPKAFCKVHPRFRTPHVGTIITGVFVASVAAFANIDEMVDLTNIGTLFAFILVCAGIIVLRIKEPDRPRPFRVPCGFVFPVLGILSCLYLIYFLPPTSWLRFAAWLNVGFVIYVGYGTVHSRLTGRRFCDRPAEHDARSARLGLSLALIGIVFMLAMRGLDLGIQGLKKDEVSRRLQGQISGVLASAPRGPLHVIPFLQSQEIDRSIGESLRIAQRNILKSESWLGLDRREFWKDEIFWFLLLPLALNAFILCPVTISKAWRAWRQVTVHGSPGITIFGAAAIVIAVIVYLQAIANYG